MGHLPVADTAHLKRRCGKGRSGYRWYVRVTVPITLRDFFGKKTVEKSLDTSDLKIAQRRKHAVLAEIVAEFERALTGRLTSADIEQEAKAYLRERVSAILARPGTFFEVIKDEFGKDIATGADLALSELYPVLEEGDWLPTIVREAERRAGRYGTTLSEAQRDEFAAALTRAEIAAISRAVAAYNGETPDPISVFNPRAIDPITNEVRLPTKPAAKVGKAVRFSEAVEAYIADRNRQKKTAWTAQTLGQMRVTFRLFEKFCRDAPLDAMERSDVADFLDKLGGLNPAYGRRPTKTLSLDELLKAHPATTEGLSSKTLNRHSGALDKFFDWAIKTGRLTGNNPAAGHRRQHHQGDHDDARRPFTPDELKHLLDGKIFKVPRASRTNPTHHTADTTLAWLILIALFSGMRLDEICSLRTEDLAQENGITFFNVVSHDGRRLKTAAAKRRVPVHSKLFEMGFGEYVSAAVAREHQYLFPALKRGGPDKKLSWYISKRFTTYRRSVGVKDPKTVFHCLRKNAATALERARIPENEAVQILGHKKLTMSYGLYSEGIDLAGLKSVVEAIKYPNTDFSDLIVAADDAPNGPKAAPLTTDSSEAPRHITEQPTQTTK
ncbi:MAG TPA: site-specific integrase [Rhizomicrobium sp.]|nr:site-specific integrase [Rhizomicrobium sp.]